MSEISNGFQLNIHGIVGLAAIVIMLVHAGWASYVILWGNERFRRAFHHFSIVAWSLWMVSPVTGFIVAIPSMS